MAIISDITTTPLSGLNHIDALLDQGPDWNYLTGANNTIRYTFSVSSGNEAGQSGLVAFNANQQPHVRAALAMVTALTGINFLETAVGTDAQVHFAATNISGFSTSGLCSWNTNYSYNPGDSSIVMYSAQAYIYLDNAEFGSQSADLTPGGRGYETLLHEIGHMLGLKHPFEEGITLPAHQDNSGNTLLSYNHTGGNHTQFSPFDVAALNWLYGRDGLGGALGIGSTGGGRYLTGTALADSLNGTNAADTLRGDGGNDTLNGGGGEDTAIFSGLYSSYTLSEAAAGRLSVNGADGNDLLDAIEILRFADRSVRRADLGTGGGDVTAPLAPALSVAKNAAGYIVGSAPSISGTAEANSTVKIYAGTALIATTVASAGGTYSASGSFLADGVYQIRSSATDAAGNVSALSAAATVNVDVTAPAAPSASVSNVSSGGVVLSNQPTISGSGEAGAMISLISVGDGGRTVIGSTQVNGGGTWSATPLPLADGSYTVNVKATDGAGNSVERASAVAFTVSSALNASGGATNDSFSSASGNNAYDGKGGIDTVLYANSRASYGIVKTEGGFTVSGGAELDSLVNIERVRFANGATALDIDGNGGQSYRIYKAAFDRTPDSVGVGFWINAMDQGQTLRQVAAGFLASNEFTQLYGANADNFTFVSKLYQNVLHRSADGAGFDFWLNGINNNTTSRADVLAYFSESSENQAQVIGQIQNGFDYTPWI